MFFFLPWEYNTCFYHAALIFFYSEAYNWKKKPFLSLCILHLDPSM